MTNFDGPGLFAQLFPGFFEDPGIRALPAGETFVEMILPLREGALRPAPQPDGITFGIYDGEHAPLLEAVREVEPDWVQYFGNGDRVLCGFDGSRPVSFCLLSDFGRYGDLHIGGPGCVGTLPAYRGRGIGLSMVAEATALLRAEGFDLSYIHYTHLEHWYAKLGYRTILRWDRQGIIG